LLHPKALERMFGGRFANLTLNARRAYEQCRLARLFIEEVENERTLLVGLDHVVRRRGRRKSGFPEWMYDADRWNDLRYTLAMTKIKAG
jgi:succinylglutamate desuccinylase